MNDTVPSRQSGDVREVYPAASKAVDAAYKLRDELMNLASTCSPEDFEREAISMLAAYKDSQLKIVDEVQAAITKTSANLIVSEGID